ncbi:MAG: LPD7 domain-containing protein [Nitrospira sp.]
MMNELGVDEQQATKQTGEPKPANGTQDESADQPRQNQRRDAAESLRKRFIEAGEQFYYRTAPGEPTKVAFTDHGKRLVTEHDDPSVIQGMVLLAKAKGWTTVRVNGTPEFKTEAWVQATIAGLDVEGYTPRGIDLARAEDRKDHRIVRSKTVQEPVDRETPHNRTTDDPVRKPERTMSANQQVAVATLEAILKARGESPTMIAAAIEEAKTRLQGERVVVGTVVDHGIDHYNHDIQNTKSYFVKVATDRGERKIWGVDLGRAFEQGKVQRGDAVALVQQAHERVTVTVPLRDESGASIGTAPQPATRNRWEIIQLDSLGLREQHQLKEAARASTQEPVVPRFDHTAVRTDRTPNVTRSPALERTRGGR